MGAAYSHYEVPAADLVVAVAAELPLLPLLSLLALLRVAEVLERFLLLSVAG
jgi:hypothetical protein